GARRSAGGRGCGGGGAGEVERGGGGGPGRRKRADGASDRGGEPLPRSDRLYRSREPEERRSLSAGLSRRCKPTRGAGRVNPGRPNSPAPTPEVRHKRRFPAPPEACNENTTESDFLTESGGFAQKTGTCSPFLLAGNPREVDFSHSLRRRPQRPAERGSVGI